MNNKKHGTDTELTRNQHRNWKWVLIFVFTLHFTLYTLHCLNGAVVNKTIAKVNEDVILQSEYDKAVNPVIEQIKVNYGELMPKEEMEKKIAGIKKEFLDQMIDQKLLLQESQKRKISVSKREIRNGVEVVKDRFRRRGDKVLTQAEAEAEFNAELRRQDYKMSQFEDKIKDDIMVNKLLDIEVVAKTKPPTEEELKDYYEKNKDKLDDPEKVSVRHILARFERGASIKDKSEALNKIKKVKQELKDGQDFAKLAEQYSEDPGSASLGGDLGFIVKGMMVKEFEEIAFKTPVGETSDYFETEFGYHILKVDAKQAKQKRSFEQVKKNLERYRINEKNQEQYEKFIKTLRDKAEISIGGVKTLRDNAPISKTLPESNVNEIEKSADVNAKDNNGWTSLMVYAMTNSLEKAKLQIEKGADVNAKDNKEQTALIFASRNNCLEIAKLLIEKGADVNAKDNDGFTALMQASINNCLEIAKLLIEKGADVNAKSNKETTALMYAKKHGLSEMRFLLEAHDAK